MSTNESLIVSVVVDPDAVIVELGGHADTRAADELERRLTGLSAQRPALVIFDLSRLQLISSICMGSLVRFHHHVTRCGGAVRLAAAQGMVLTALERARLDLLFSMHPALQRARDAASNHSP